MLLQGIILETIYSDPQLDGIIKLLSRLCFVPPDELLEERDLGLNAGSELVAHELGQCAHEPARQPRPVFTDQLAVHFEAVAQVGVLGYVQRSALEKEDQSVKELRRQLCLRWRKVSLDNRHIRIPDALRERLEASVDAAHVGFQHKDQSSNAVGSNLSAFPTDLSFIVSASCCDSCAGSIAKSGSDPGSARLSSSSSCAGSFRGWSLLPRASSTLLRSSGPENLLSTRRRTRGRYFVTLSSHEEQASRLCIRSCSLASPSWLPPAAP